MFQISQEINHDRIIAKLQHFADSMQQRKKEKESLSLAIGKCDIQSEIRSEILVYEEILNDYYDEFQEILIR